MNFLGHHGPAAVAGVFLLASIPFTLLTWFRRGLHPDTYTLAATLGTLLYTTALIFFAVADIQNRTWYRMPIWALLVVMNLWFLYHLWKKWGGRKRARKALGAKSKALRDALVRRMREAQPEGTR